MHYFMLIDHRDTMKVLQSPDVNSVYERLPGTLFTSRGGKFYYLEGLITDGRITDDSVLEMIYGRKYLETLKEVLLTRFTVTLDRANDWLLSEEVSINDDTL